MGSNIGHYSKAVVSAVIAAASAAIPILAPTWPTWAHALTIVVAGLSALGLVYTVPNAGVSTTPTPTPAEDSPVGGGESVPRRAETADTTTTDAGPNEVTDEVTMPADTNGDDVDLADMPDPGA